MFLVIFFREKNAMLTENSNIKMLLFCCSSWNFEVQKTCLCFCCSDSCWDYVCCFCFCHIRIFL